MRRAKRRLNRRLNSFVESSPALLREIDKPDQSRDFRVSHRPAISPLRESADDLGGRFALLSGSRIARDQTLVALRQRGRGGGRLDLDLRDVQVPIATELW